jgi:hypothetical protein
MSFVAEFHVGIFFICFKHILFINTLVNGIGQQAQHVQAISLNPPI